MSNQPIKAHGLRKLYLNIISVSSIIMIAVGTVLLTQYIVNQMVAQKYQVSSSEEIQCLRISPLPTTPGNYPTAEDFQIRNDEKARCVQNLETLRINRMNADLIAPLVFEVMGVVLFVTHFGVLRRQWNA
ncbi:MAG: hypothetical protein WCO78_02880 [Candidatus Roizmanbacteria bacterium]